MAMTVYQTFKKTTHFVTLSNRITKGLIFINYTLFIILTYPSQSNIRKINQIRQNLIK